MICSTDTSLMPEGRTASMQALERRMYLRRNSRVMGYSSRLERYRSQPYEALQTLHSQRAAVEFVTGIHSSNPHPIRVV